MLGAGAPLHALLDNEITMNYAFAKQWLPARNQTGHHGKECCKSSACCRHPERCCAVQVNMCSGCMYVCACACACASVCGKCVCVCVRVCMFAYARVCMRVYVFMRVCLCVCACVCMCLCVCVCAFVHVCFHCFIQCK